MKESRVRWGRAITAWMLLVAAGAPAAAEPLWRDGRNDLTLFGGVMTEGDFPGTGAVPLYSTLTDIYVVGASYNRELWRYDFADYGFGVSLGAEIGGSVRFGDENLAGPYADADVSGEIWGGPSLRIGDFHLGPVAFSFGVVAGLSAVEHAIGIERLREYRAKGDASLLYYIGPETQITFDALPNTSFVYRTHHRSGAQNVIFLPTIGDMGDTSNTNFFGIRHRF